MENDYGFNRDDNPPRRPRVTPIRKIGASDQLTCVVLSPGIQGFKTHWIGHTVPCRNDKKLCQYCLQQVPPPMKWSGFLLVAVQKPDVETVFIEITEFTLDRFRKETSDFPSFRGLQVFICRERKNIRAPVKITVLGHVGQHRQLAPDQDVVPTLRRIWKLED